MRYYWNDYEEDSIALQSSRLKLFFSLQNKYPDVVLLFDGIECKETANIKGMFAAICDEKTIEALKPKPIEAVAKKVKAKVPVQTKVKTETVVSKKIAKKQQYLVYLQSQIEITKNQIERLEQEK